MTEAIWLDLYWAATCLWAALCFVALLDALGALKDEREDLLYTQPLGNGRKTVAEGRYLVSKWFVLGFFVFFLVSEKAVLDLFFSPPPLPETAENLAKLRFATCVVVFAFWMAKRANRAMRKKAEDLADVKGEMQDLSKLERDTNERTVEVERKVGEIDEKLEGPREK